MTNNELVKSKKDDLPELPVEVKNQITNAKRKKFCFSNAKKTVKDVDILYFLGNKCHADISLISSQFLTAGFALDYLKTLNDFIMKRYNLPQLTLLEFTDNDKIEQTKQKISELENEPIINWLRDEGLEKLKDAIKDVDVDNINRLVDLGHIVNLSEKELSFNDKNEDIEIYDIVYRYLNRLDDFELTVRKNEIACEVISIKKISGRESTEFRVECTGSLNAREQSKRFFMDISKDVIR